MPPICCHLPPFHYGCGCDLHWSTFCSLLVLPYLAPDMLSSNVKVQVFWFEIQRPCKCSTFICLVPLNKKLRGLHLCSWRNCARIKVTGCVMFVFVRNRGGSSGGISWCFGCAASGGRSYDKPAALPYISIKLVSSFDSFKLLHHRSNISQST